MADMPTELLENLEKLHEKILGRNWEYALRPNPNAKKIQKQKNYGIL